MKWPNNIHFCKKCGIKAMPQWFRSKREEWVDMDYPYETFRPSLVRVAERDLCNDCRKMLIENVDAVNNWTQTENRKQYPVRFEPVQKGVYRAANAITTKMDQEAPNA